MSGMRHSLRTMSETDIRTVQARVCSGIEMLTSAAATLCRHGDPVVLPSLTRQLSDILVLAKIAGSSSACAERYQVQARFLESRNFLRSADALRIKDFAATGLRRALAEEEERSPDIGRERWWAVPACVEHNSRLDQRTRPMAKGRVVRVPNPRKPTQRDLRTVARVDHPDREREVREQSGWIHADPTTFGSMGTIGPGGAALTLRAAVEFAAAVERIIRAVWGSSARRGGGTDPRPGARATVERIEDWSMVLARLFIKEQADRWTAGGG